MTRRRLVGIPNATVLLVTVIGWAGSAAKPMLRRRPTRRRLVLARPGRMLVDPDDLQNAANEASSAMGPLAQVVSAYYHSLSERQMPYPLVEELVRDFQTWYLDNEGAE